MDKLINLEIQRVFLLKLCFNTYSWFSRTKKFTNYMIYPVKITKTAPCHRARESSLLNA